MPDLFIGSTTSIDIFISTRADSNYAPAWAYGLPPVAPERPGDGLKRLRRALRLVHSTPLERRMDPRHAPPENRRKGRARRGRVLPARSRA